MGASKWISGAGLALALTAAAVAHATPSFPSSAEGDWMGALRSRGATERIFIHIHKTPSGDYASTMDSPDRGEMSIPIKPLAAGDNALAFTLAGAEFQGAWNAARGQWQGTWTEAGVSSPISLTQNVDSRTSRRLRRP